MAYGFLIELRINHLQNSYKISMLKKFNTKDLIVIALLAGLYVAFALAGAILQTILEFPMASAIINIFISSAVVVLTCLIIKKFGAAILMLLIYSVVAIPLPVLGTPGFLPKVIIGLIAGLIADSIYNIFKRNEKVTSIIIGSAVQIAMGFMILGFGYLFSIPNLEKVIGLFLSPLIIIATIIIGGFSGYLGYFIYQKIKNKAFIKQLQS